MPARSSLRMFGQARDTDAPVPWSEVEARLRTAITIWIVAGGAARPLWAVWLDDALWFSTGSARLWQAMAASPAMSAHLEDGHDVVVVEGTHRRVDDDVAALQPFCDAYNEKYSWDIAPMSIPGPVVVLEPRVVLAWKTGHYLDAKTDDFPLASSRFVF